MTGMTMCSLHIRITTVLALRFTSCLTMCTWCDHDEKILRQSPQSPLVISLLCVTGSKANAGGARENAGGARPNTGGAMPNAGGARPNTGGAMPNAGGARENAGGARENAGGARENAGGARENAGGARPNTGGAMPNAGGARENAGGARENAGGARENAGGARENAGGAREGSGRLAKPLSRRTVRALQAQASTSHMGPPYPVEMQHAQFTRISGTWARHWARRGLSKVCSLCRVLTPAEHCKTVLQNEEGSVCRKCLERDAVRALPAAAPMPPELRNLTFIEKRLISFVRVDEYLLDLPTNNVPGQWGRAYVTPLEIPDACNIMADVTFSNGVIYISLGGRHEEQPLPVRPRKLMRALTYLLEHHPRYTSTPKTRQNVQEAINRLTEIDRDENNPAHPAIEVQHNALTHGGPPPPDAVMTELRKAKGHARLDRDVDVIIFPHLFPTGSGGFPGLQACKLPDYCRRRLLGEDPRFQQDPQYIFWLLETWFKHKVSSNTQVFVGPTSRTRLFHSQQKIRQAAYTSLRQVPGTQPYIYAKRSVGLSMIEQLGKPKWFMTLTCHAKQPSILLACVVASLRTEHGMVFAPIDEVLQRALEILDNYMRDDENSKWTTEEPGIRERTPSQLCNDFPAVVAREFMRQTRALMRWLGAEQEESVEPEGMQEPDIMDTILPVDTVKEAPKAPFHITDYTLRVEWQKRGYPHAHIMMWTQKEETSSEDPSGAVVSEVHDFGPSDSESIPDTRPATSTEQLYDKYVCTRSPRRWREVYNDEEMAGLADFLVHKHSPYCGAYTLGACRFGFPHEKMERTKKKEAREMMISRSKNTYLVRRRSDANMMGLYNTDILRKWRGCKRGKCQRTPLRPPGQRGEIYISKKMAQCSPYP